MKKSEYAQYIASPEWQERRKEALSSSNNRCARCELPRWLAAIVYDQDLHVHHLHYKNVGNEAPDDLQVLCRRCHEIETFGRSELKELQTATCEMCKKKHWDRYSDSCETCRRVLSPDFPIVNIFMGWDERRDQDSWRIYVVEMVTVLWHGGIGVLEVVDANRDTIRSLSPAWRSK